ncbi:GreA/GreB family elongation factor [Leeuwenhoekiella aequorea]|uniref:Transcription elongation factor GreB n=1 Tax=Leeuwenhoekiella aequorea TaxID=283736 RepID=A0A4Q0PCJ9_9FLAO|nr:GreA/GreB family elongation factor [Leeuwenhoekiella aequorea]RXG24550.1 transcription elongation factor GreB [Leeuwenhoekiella aequorea]
MSRGFVKEDDQEEAPIIPPRAALPEGVLNYVTQNGLQELKDEKKHLLAQIANLNEADDREQRRSKAILVGRLQLLNERILSARVIDDIDESEVRFGATVRYKINNLTNVLCIVGVDEADVKKNKIAFTAPIARVLTGKKVGDVAKLQLGNEVRKLLILSIDYVH